ncbi:MAG: DNA repair protein RecN [Candidatus Lustribacter sp.]|jgi:DNA repair protein RecN (Recombination protein N)
MGRSDQTRVTPVLLRLRIDNVGLIAHAQVEFGDAFTAFTGETGSGKTMLLGALDAALGGRVERELIRGDRLRVALEIAAGEGLRDLLDTMGIELADDDDVVIVREVTAAGRSQARVNGVAVSAGQLRALGAHVVDAIGQGEAQRLLEPAFARDLLDRFAGPAALALRDRLRESYETARALRAERDALTGGAERALAAAEFARFALGEIEAAALAEGEDDRLRERREVLGSAERIAEALMRARAALEDDGGAVDALGAAAHALSGIARFGGAFAALSESAGALQADSNALAAEIARSLDDVELDPLELENVTARLDAIETLKKKYGASIGAVLAARDRFAATLEADAGRDERLAAIDDELAAIDAALAADAAELRAQRSAAIGRCEERIAAELHALAMPAARFGVALEPLDEIAAHGADRIEFRFSANPGEPERPLARVASGGERSRVFLALVVVLADRHDARTFVFDEIDAGIGGATALAVGARLARLAGVTQVVCVTHLAQIASYAGTHYALRKYDDGGETTIEVVALSDDDRLAEIARMLSGDTKRISLEHAASLVASTRADR